MVINIHDDIVNNLLNMESDGLLDSDTRKEEQLAKQVA